jgi:hypothetical protein
VANAPGVIRVSERVLRAARKYDRIGRMPATDAGRVLYARAARELAVAVLANLRNWDLIPRGRDDR